MGEEDLCDCCVCGDYNRSYSSCYCCGGSFCDKICAKKSIRPFEDKPDEAYCLDCCSEDDLNEWSKQNFDKIDAKMLFEDAIDDKKYKIDTLKSTIKELTKKMNILKKSIKRENKNK